MIKTRKQGNVDLEELTKLLSLTWNNDKKMVDYCMAHSKYIKIDDLYINVCSAKPAITKTIWYDDERPDPGSGWETFIALNERNNMPHLFELERRHFGVQHLYLIVNYCGDKSGGRLVVPTYKDDDEKMEVVRKVTESDLQQINEAVQGVRDNYSRRLVNYYKRYSDQVTSKGYWANR